jgi:hypothetical protein
VLEVADPALWAEIEAIASPGWLDSTIDPNRRIVTAQFERQVLPQLSGRVLVRYARRDTPPADLAQLQGTIAALDPQARRVLAAAQRHALDDELSGEQAWDPAADQPAVAALLHAGLLLMLPAGRYRLHPDLPPPPAVDLDLADAVMARTALPPATPGPVALLHDIAALAAAIAHHPPRLTHADTLGRTEARRIGRQLGDPDLAASGDVERDLRWGRALRALRALPAIAPDPLTRVLTLDPALEAVLAGTAEEACDRLIHRLVERDLHPVVPAVRAALRAAGPDAVDEVVFLELLRDRHREILIPRWHRDGVDIYPDHGAGAPRPYDDAGWEAVEARMIAAVLKRLTRIGVITREEGVFAGTADGRRWAGAETARPPPIWVSGDLEIVVPPDAVTPWERFQIERLSRCLQRDTVDRYRIERPLLATWMSTHDEEEMIALLTRRSPGLPAGVAATLRSWAASARRMVLTRGVLLE